ncbi:MAG: hypothetical protein AVDCRST_MAG51-19, partial [uncultured Ramlibacter sp.]
MQRRPFLLSSLALAAVPATGLAQGTAWPARPVRIV